MGRARGEPKHTKVEHIYAQNGFGPEILDTRKEEEYCVEADKELPPPVMMK